MNRPFVVPIKMSVSDAAVPITLTDDSASIDADIGITVNAGGINPQDLNYNLLDNKPSINGVTLIGNKTSEDLNITSDVVHSDTTANWNAQTDLVSRAGHIYVYTDYIVMDDVPVAGMKIGDGNAYLIDIPFVSGNTADLYDHINDRTVHITNEERLFWNNKVTCFLSQGEEETVVFTKENING